MRGRSPTPSTTPAYYGGDSAHSGYVGDDQKSQMEATVEGAGTVSFYWKVSSEEDYDYLEFYIDGTLKDRISGTVNWQLKSYVMTGSGKHSLMWQYIKDSGGSSGSDCGWVDYLQGPGTAPPPPDLLAEAVDSSLSYTTAGNASWSRQTSTYYSGNDAAQSGDIADSQSTRMETTVQGAGTLTFYWKVSSESSCDYLEFWLDGVRQHRISGDVDWQQKSYNITGSGTHTLKWQYIKDSSVDDGSDCGWVDYVQWSGSTTPVYTPIPEDWDTVTYTYDPAGRRTAKAFDGQTCLKYVYDGDQCIAEYDGNNNLLRKYIYGPGIDQPVSMIDVKNDNATWYYHFDALGSVVALSDADGDTAEIYEYSVYGQVAASDPNHMNLFMFTGREFDKETGLYYYRARYYNPEIGRFLQTDPIGYMAGMNLYSYCGNEPVGHTDPWGLTAYVWANNTLYRLIGNWTMGEISRHWRAPLGVLMVSVDNRGNGIVSFNPNGDWDGPLGSGPFESPCAYEMVRFATPAYVLRGEPNWIPGPFPNDALAPGTPNPCDPNGGVDPNEVNRKLRRLPRGLTTCQEVCLYLFPNYPPSKGIKEECVLCCTESNTDAGWDNRAGRQEGIRCAGEAMKRVCNIGPGPFGTTLPPQGR